MTAVNFSNCIYLNGMSYINVFWSTGWMNEWDDHSAILMISLIDA
jgi:hypothetical protein